MTKEAQSKSALEDENAKFKRLLALAGTKFSAWLEDFPVQLEKVPCYFA